MKLTNKTITLVNISMFSFFAAFFTYDFYEYAHYHGITEIVNKTIKQTVTLDGRYQDNVFDTHFTYFENKVPTKNFDDEFVFLVSKSKDRHYLKRTNRNEDKLSFPVLSIYRVKPNCFLMVPKGTGNLRNMKFACQEQINK